MAIFISPGEHRPVPRSAADPSLTIAIVYDLATRQRAITLHESGLTFSQVSRATGISRFSIRQWTTRITPSPRKTSECPVQAGDLDSTQWKAAPRPGGAVNISVARRASVALMDEHVGAKY